MPLARDILRQIQADFGIDRGEQIVSRIEARRAALPTVYSDRVIRCAVYVASNDAPEANKKLWWNWKD